MTGNLQSLVLFAILSISAQSLMAGDRSCIHTSLELSCEVYNEQNQATKIQESSMVSDHQPEENQPSECLASVLLNTPEGKFVAVFNDSSNKFMAWIRIGERTQILQWDISLEKNIPLNLKYSGFIFSCLIH